LTVSKNGSKDMVTDGIDDQGIAAFYSNALKRLSSNLAWMCPP
jgi:hypothetical protein